MTFSQLGLPVFMLLIVTSMAILMVRDWRWSLIALAVQYLGVFFFVVQAWPFSMAVVKLVVGWMSGAALGATFVGARRLEEKRTAPAGWLFQFLAGSLVVILVFSFAPQVLKWFPTNTNLYLVESGTLLTMMGMLLLGTSSQPFRVILGLLTFFSGFEVLYASVEISILLAGLLAAVNLGLALVGIYFITNQPDEGGQ